VNRRLVPYKPRPVLPDIRQERRESSISREDLDQGEKKAGRHVIGCSRGDVAAKDSKTTGRSGERVAELKRPLSLVQNSPGGVKIAIEETKYHLKAGERAETTGGGQKGRLYTDVEPKTA